MVIASPPLAPRIEDARLAADAVAAAGASRVLLFGSVARGDQTADSDIDLVAIFDDLDYPARRSTRLALQAAAAEAAGRHVDVRVTDWPEWTVRSGVVTTSLEHRIAADAVVLCDRPPRHVNWRKEIAVPATDEAEAAASLGNTNRSLQNLEDDLYPSRAEQAAVADADPAHHATALTHRVGALCAQAHLVLENSLKTLIHHRGEAGPPRTHHLDVLVGRLDGPTHHEAARILDPLDLTDASRWRERGTYPADFEEIAMVDLVPLAHRLCTAAIGLAALAADTLDATPPPPAVTETRRYVDRIAATLQRWDLTATTPAAIINPPGPTFPEHPNL